MAGHQGTTRDISFGLSVNLGVAGSAFLLLVNIVFDP
jgi:hypothetical protein